MNIENDLNIPPDEEPIGKKISRIATKFLLPVALPASSALIGWIAQRRASSKLEQVQKEQDDIRILSRDIKNLKAELELLQSRRKSLTTDELKKIQQHILHAEQQDYYKISQELDKIQDLLVKRQNIYCSIFTSRLHRFDLENQHLKPYSYSRSYDKDLGLYTGVLDILANEKHCSMDGRHGHIMWVYMDLWKARAQLRMYKNVAKRIEEA